MDLDYILPFAAIPENGREIDSPDDKSELAHQIMLVNLLRILGAVKAKKASRHFDKRPRKLYIHCLPTTVTTVSSATMASTQKYRSGLRAIAGVLNTGASIFA
jgi:hypothetical protein